MKKRLLSVVLAATMVFGSLTPVLAGDEGTTARPGYELYHGHDLSNVTIDFWNYITGDDNPTLTKWVDKYNEENPYGITIHQDSMDGTVLMEKLPVALSSGNGPQLTLCGLDVAAYAEQGLILELSDIFEYTDLKREDFIDGLLDITSYEGGLYGIPFYIGVTFMFWNKDLYRQAGLDPEVPPKTWDELYEYSKKINEVSDQYYGLNFSYGLTYSVYDVMASYGGHIITLDDETGLYKNELISDPNIEALSFWQNFYKEGLNPLDAKDELFYAGIIGTTIAGPWVGGTAKEDYGIDVGYGLAPGADAGTYYYCASMNMNITNNATEDEILACYDFMSYWNSLEPCVDFSTENHTPAYLKEAIADPRIQSNTELAAMSNFEGREAWNWVPPGFNHGNEVNEQLGSMLEAIAMGEDVTEALTKCSGYVDEIIERANQERIDSGKAAQ